MKGGFIAFRCGNFDNTSEREQFRLLCKKMKSKYSNSEHFYLMIANYNIFDSEFDAIVIKHDAIIAVEFKNYGGRIIAKENGDWTANGVIIKGGSRKTVYQQARVNHAAIKNGFRELGINNEWLKDIPTVIVFNQTINLENQLSSKTQSWLHITDNAHFLDKIEDLTCSSTDISNINIIDLAIKLNLSSYIVPEFSSYQIDKKVNETTCEGSIEDGKVEDIEEDGNNTELKETQTTSEHKILNQVLQSYNRLTPNHIFSLRSQQLFVFGTDRQGSQKYGASGIAAKKFGAEVGITEGKTGFCYALPTRGFSIDELRDAVDRFIKFVDENNQYIYLVTPVGCGHAGFNVSEVAEMFKSLVTYENVMLPQVFINEYIKQEENNRMPLELDDRLEEDNFNENIYQRIKLILKKKGLSYNNEGSFLLKDKLGNVIAEAELGVESERVVFSPFNIQSEIVFKNHGYSIMSPEEYLEKENN